MTVMAKHQTNAGGAVSARDSKGDEERKNIAILHRKWPRTFRDNPKRANEVILKWPSAAEDFDGDGGSAPSAKDPGVVQGSATKGIVTKGVQKRHLKTKPVAPRQVKMAVAMTR